MRVGSDQLPLYQAWGPLVFCTPSKPSCLSHPLSGPLAFLASALLISALFSSIGFTPVYCGIDERQ